MTQHTNNTRYSRDAKAPSPKLKADGSNYKWRMFYDGDSRIIDTDSLIDIMSCLLPQYAADSVEERLQRRRTYMQNLRFSMNIKRFNTPKLIDNLQPWEKEVVLAEKLPVYGWGDGSRDLYSEQGETPDIWSAETPLILVESDYQPYGDVNRPISSEGDYKETSNLFWLRTETEEDFLNTLHQLNVVTYGTPGAA